MSTLTIQERLLNSIVESIFSKLELRHVLSVSAQQVGSCLGVARCMALSGDVSEGEQVPIGIEWVQGESYNSQDTAAMDVARHIYSVILSSGLPFIANNCCDEPVLLPVRRQIDELNIKSLLAVPCESCTQVQGVTDARVQGVLVLLECDGGSDYDSRAYGFCEDTITFVMDVARAIGTAIKHSKDIERAQNAVKRFRAVAESQDIASIHIDEDGRVTFACQKLEDFLGKRSALLIGRPFENVVIDNVVTEDCALVSSAYSRIKNRLVASETVICRLQHASAGFVKTVQMRFVSIVGERGQILGYQCSIVEFRSGSLRRLSAPNEVPLYQRLVEHSDAIMFHVDSNHMLTFISRRSLDFFGVSPDDFARNDKTPWYDLVHPEDKERVREIAINARENVSPFEEEFRVVNRVSGHTRWVLARMTPVAEGQGQISGWDGFGLDITLRREAEEALEGQSKKVRALYTVASAVRGHFDPQHVANRGLAALCDATNASAGLCYLYGVRGNKEHTKLIAHSGFSTNFSAALDELSLDNVIDNVSDLANVIGYESEFGKTVVVPDVTLDTRASKLLLEEEGILSLVLVPICVDEHVLGVLGLFSRQKSGFHGGDVMLVSAAANQIGLASRQARLFSAYRKQTRNITALYRMSHELSRNLELEDIFQHAFRVIRDELGLRRIWLGLLNEQGTRIVGKAAFGPGWKRKLVHMTVDATNNDHPIARVVSQLRPLIITDPNELSESFGARRLLSRFAVESIALIPLVSSGQVLGVLAVQLETSNVQATNAGASSSANIIDSDDMTLLISLGNEIAAAVLGKRFEERIAEGEKMRAAGLLAAGIAHNFNNLLQAVLGQASLLEMQKGEPMQVAKAARIITEASKRGAGLVRQLLSFAQLEEPIKEAFDVSSFMTRSISGLKGYIKDGQDIVVEVANSLPFAFADSRQVLRILGSLVRNASDAMLGGGKIYISCNSVLVDKDSPHYEVPYGSYVCIGVKDTGIGMDEDIKRRCFEPFFTTKNVDVVSGLSMTGSGLGLAAAYALARRNGGRIVVDSAPGQGALFTLYIPVDIAVSESVSIDEPVDEVKDSLLQDELSRDEIVNI